MLIYIKVTISQVVTNSSNSSTLTVQFQLQIQRVMTQMVDLDGTCVHQLQSVKRQM